MFHGLDNRFLYSAYQIHSTFVNIEGDQKWCSGTGFWMKDRDSKMILITNRHVLDIAYSDNENVGYSLQNLVVSGKAISHCSKRPEIDQKWSVDISQIKLSKDGKNDIACLIHPTVTAFQGSEEQVIDYWIPRDLFATKNDFEASFSVCDFVAYPGFPPWYDKRQNRPILRTGTISSDPRYDYSWSSDYEGECVAYEAFSYGGSSGGPVFAVQKGPKPGAGISFPGYRPLKLIGINSGHLPVAKNEKNIHSGISLLYKASAILDIIDA
ncbi:MAG: trypsin-like peptidase domain-containing protein [Gammaproteobacteria bacterium]|nr:trypsin-like peptidase domain-containing protein [Gammaproteobacteria bacterium]MYF53407.1 trypsin-like peptidase domain-containing protein [Gammaproteobacteria bacterium]MYK43533.1 trypsin-like peptidase domain-containing protein [Gammaproteobacteria bacterium]